MDDIKKYIILLLGALDNQPIRGKLFLQKEMFLFSFELESDNLKHLLNFEPHNFGPYSKKLELELTEMINEGLVQVSEREDTKIYNLTKKGQEYFENIVRLDNSMLNGINKLKLGSERLGYKGLLRYVYFNYPKFTTKSKIKNEVLGGN